MIPVLQYLVPMIVGRVVEALVQDGRAAGVRETDAPQVAPVVREAVEEVVVREIRPVLINATNNEPWYQSRVTLGAIASILSGLLGLAGWAVGSEELVPLLAAIGPILGGLLTWYGRWRARKPLGTV